MVNHLCFYSSVIKLGYDELPKKDINTNYLFLNDKLQKKQMVKFNC
jgi:hypothetical protein